MDSMSVGYFAAGALSQIAFHELSHAAYARDAGIDYTTHIEGVSYRYHYFADNRRDLARVSRMGYLVDTLTAEAVPWVDGWENRPFLNGLYFGSILDRGKAAVEGEGDVPLIGRTGGPSEKTTRVLLGASVAVDLCRWRWPRNEWAVGVSVGLHGTLLVAFVREF